MTKTEAKELLKGDYIPGGRAMSWDEIKQLQWRPTEEHEVHQCGQATGDDVQSGRIYCGKIADHVAAVADGSMLCLCERHYNDVLRRSGRERTTS